MKRIIMAVRFVLWTTAACLVPAVAFAHPDPGSHSGLGLGFMHPLTGADHLLAMVAVGMLAATLGGRALWVLPLTFLAVMTIGGGLGINGVGLPLVEMVVALSVMVMGLTVALPQKCPLLAAAVMVGTFALYHGHAHGTELTGGVSAIPFVLGFTVATATLHSVGIGLGVAVKSFNPIHVRYAFGASGLAIAIFGIGLVTKIV
jgi:urease accessory protein